MNDERMSTAALRETARALADRGEDYGWNVYRRGNRIPPDDARRIVDDGGAGWLEAFRHAISAYKAATGGTWHY